MQKKVWGLPRGRKLQIHPANLTQLDDGDVVEGLGVDVWRRVRRVRRVDWWPCGTHDGAFSACLVKMNNPLIHFENY